MTPCTKQQTIDFLRLLIGDADDTMRELAPDGWEHSPLFVFFHPTLEQAYEGHLRFRQGMNRMIERISKGKDKPNPLPTLEEFASENDWDEKLPHHPQAELLELLGRVIFELEQYRVQHPSGCIIHFEIGRDWGTFIAQLLNMHYPLDEREFYEYDFYSTTFLEYYIDPSPVWQLFFRRMKLAGYDLLRPPHSYKDKKLPLPLRVYQEVYGSLPAAYQQ